MQENKTTNTGIKLLTTLLFFLLACNSTVQKTNKPQGLTEEEIRQYFADSLSGRYGFGQFEKDSTKTFAHFFRTNYPGINTKYSDNAFPFAFEEEYIDTTKIDTLKKWFRIIVVPCFRRPYCFVVEKKGDKSFLTTKVTNGDGGYHTGVLLLTTHFMFRDTLYDNISKRLDTCRFWTLGEDTSCHSGLDGETWIFEAIENGRYNIISRWWPQGCGDSTTMSLSEIGFELNQLGKLDKVLTAIGERQSGMYER
ncbi:hypothetical protein A4H97_13745 [Niastella yeongjuensis]|uniref:Lipoprotein n=1 Tax=Niastella yeongjuensis TaxID=354355 RepID=A0A1V9E3K3_9BACT|nr:hypothetical protein [Niastella yeongjuensis]OQP40682.1 hypothetical protein A4H97_13745 [Niastella yeongjuensis]SEP04722.1 hypothetical protein SAMN05660816_04308 [Niastella yeongjuensis]